MKIYIASSWKNELAVRLLTTKFREQGHYVFSFIENNHGEQKGHSAVDSYDKPIPFDVWVLSERGRKSFEYDTNSAMTADLVVYIGPSGTDAWAEVGAAYAANVPVVGVWVKGEQVGLMRRMVNWFDELDYLLLFTKEMSLTNKRDVTITRALMAQFGSVTEALS